MANAPAGWFDQGDGTQRYWDGNAWTEHRAPAASAQPPAASSPAAAPPGYAAQPAGFAATPPAYAAQPPGYAAMPGNAPYVKPRKRVWPWVLGIGGGILLLIIGLVTWGVVALIGVVTGPVDTVNDFADAVDAGDCAAMEKTVTRSFLTTYGWDDCGTFESDATSLATSSFNANESSIVNNVATVTAEIRYAGDTDAYIGTYTLIKEDGEWRVSAFSIDNSGF